MSEQEIELDWLAKWNLYTPEKIALVDIQNNRNFTYRDFYRISNGLVPWLKKQGVNKGDRIAVFAQNKIETIFLFFALKRMGAILVPINFRFSNEELDYVLKDAGCTQLFYDPEYIPLIQNLKTKTNTLSMNELEKAVLAAISFEDTFSFEAQYDRPCMILYTSGTTGFPKGVMITPKILFWNSVNTNLSLNISDNDCMISFLPLFHTGGWNVLLTPFIHHGAKTIFLPKFDSSTILKLCESQRVSVLFGVPTTLSTMAKDPIFEQVELGSVRFAVVGGEPMPHHMIETWHRRGIAIRQGFGLTECGPNCFSLSEKDAETKIGSIGRPNFYVQTKIIDEQGNDVSDGEIGELLLKGPMVMKGYWEKEQATKEAFIGDWLRTGDLVKKDADHYYYVAGRRKEMYISGGENIYPAEVERVLNSHPDLDEVAVVGVKDEKWGEVGKAFIVPKHNSSPGIDELIDYCNLKLAKFKTPKHFQFINELPKSSSGKILKRQLDSTI